MKYSDEQHIQKAFEYTEKLLDYIKENQVRKEDLITEEPLQWLVTTPLYNIGEHIYALSKKYKAGHDGIHWSVIAGLRHRLVHDYDGTNWNIITEVVFEELPELLAQLKKLQ